jgi:hypothetical protein
MHGRGGLSGNSRSDDGGGEPEGWHGNADSEHAGSTHLSLPVSDDYSMRAQHFYITGINATEDLDGTFLSCT